MIEEQSVRAALVLTKRKNRAEEEMQVLIGQAAAL
jgi:hypothetical protein